MKTLLSIVFALLLASTAHAGFISQPGGVVGGAGCNPVGAAVLKGDGAGACANAVAGTDYVAPTGDGSGLTALNASQLTTGTVANARLDADLGAIAGLVSAADKGIQFTGSGTAAVYDLTAFAKTILDDADATAARATLGVVIGTNVQAFDAELAALAGLTSAADALPFFTGSGTASVTTLTSFARTLLDDAAASNARSTLGLVIGTDVAAQSSLALYLPLTAGTGQPLSDVLVLDNLGLQLTASDTNPACNAGEYRIYAKTTGTDIIFCQNGVTSTLDSLAGGGGSLTVTEVDASPSVTATQLTFPNGTVTDGGGGVAIITLAGSGDVTAASSFGTDNVIIRSDGTGKGVQSSACTLDDSANLGCTGSISSGVGTGVSGTITLTGASSGAASITVASAAGTPANIQLPTATGAANSVLMSDGATPQVTSWQTTTGTGSVVRAGSPTFTGAPVLASPSATTITTQVVQSTGADPADSGVIRLANAELIAWENSTPGTDLTLGVDINNILTSSVPINATTGFRIGNAATSGQALVGNGTNFVSTAIPLSITGTANEIARDVATGAVTLSIPADFSLAGKTSSIPYPVGAAPTVDAAGEIAFDNNLWATDRGTPIFFDGTAAVAVVAALVSDTPNNGQVPKWNTGGTITWENDTTGAGVGCVTSGSDNQIVTDDGATGCVSEQHWTIASNVLTSSATGKADLSAASGTDGLKIPVAAGAAPTADGYIAVDSTAHTLKAGLNGTSTTVITSASLGTGVQTFLATPSSANLASAVTGETGTGALVFADSPTLVTPALGTPASGVITNLTGTATNIVYDAEGTGNTITIPFENWFDVAGCGNTTAGHVWNAPATNAPVPTCDTGTNNKGAYLAFDADTLESIQGSFVLPTGFTGAIDIKFKYKMASATTGAIGLCFQMVRIIPDTSTSDQAFPALAAGNCVSDTVPGTAGIEGVATITNATCTSCAAGDTVNWRLVRDAAATAVTDSATGDGHLLKWGKVVRAAL